MWNIRPEEWKVVINFKRRECCYLFQSTYQGN